MNDITGYFFNSRSPWRLDERTISGILDGSDGLKLSLNHMTTRGGMPVTTRMFIRFNLHLCQVNFVEGSNYSAETVRDHLLIPENFIRSLESDVRAFKTPYCEYCDLPRMCVYQCSGPRISEIQLQAEIEECLRVHFPEKYTTYITEDKYQSFYGHLKGVFPDPSIFIGVYLMAFWCYFNLPRDRMPLPYDNLHYPCMVDFDSPYYKRYK